ncbi:radical SAM protein [Suicoccus acidiformans]|uniref:Heme chaperone HemW n=1 Tax=Suicoccus acidiformans TaxID=2036206 RepID=A0A347WM40_9LACT|nr:radical SAM family heme chaperone HemW [Suicoccus acidiformans]AXY26147.1 radical SAM protein [Suicoccus acidiformans]
MQKLGLYIHIPFCAKRCNYCAFLTFAENDQMIEGYVEHLIKEIALYQTDAYEVDTIYIGGGTPSHIPAEQMAKVLEAVKQYFLVSETCEVTIEMNPESVTLEKLAAYQAMGINRYSMGVQSFNDEVLAIMGRVHNRAKALDKIRLLHEASIDNFSIDLMFANPKQDVSVLTEDIETLLRMQVPHVSVYSLMFEPHTNFTKWLREGQISQVDDETDRQMYHLIQERLIADGLEQYEISNFARPGKACRHNLKYWRLEDYLGLGLGASSNIGLERFTNYQNFLTYYEAIDRGERPVETLETMPLEEREKEFIMLNTRLIQGFSIKEMNQRFGIDFLEKYQAPIAKHLATGLVEIQGDRFKFTPYGLDVGNQFYVDIF